MGLFGSFTKPGPGIPKDAPKKKGLARYFEIFFRKLKKLFLLNIITFIMSIPFLAIMYIFAPITPESPIIKAVGDLSEQEVISLIGRFHTLFAVTAFALLGSGPASAAYAYITRCFTREEHAWIFSDFKDKFLENFKQSIILTVFNILSVFLLMNGFNFYSSQYALTSSALWLVCEYGLILFMLMLIFMNFYVYQMMVTFKSSIVQLLKNSLLLSLSQLPMNILLLILVLSLNFLMFNTLTVSFALILSFLITISLVRFPIEYSSARAIEKKILSKLNVDDEGEE